MGEMRDRVLSLGNKSGTWQTTDSAQFSFGMTTWPHALRATSEISR